MDTVIQFTFAQFLAYAGAIITISTAIGVIINLISKAREPEKNKMKESKPVRIGGILTAFFVQKEIRLPKIVYTSILMIYKL